MSIDDFDEAAVMAALLAPVQHRRRVDALRWWLRNRIHRTGRMPEAAEAQTHAAQCFPALPGDQHQQIAIDAVAAETP